MSPKHTKRCITSAVKGLKKIENIRESVTTWLLNVIQMFVFFTERQTGRQTRDGGTEGKNERSRIVIII